MLLTSERRDVYLLSKGHCPPPEAEEAMHNPRRRSCALICSQVAGIDRPRELLNRKKPIVFFVRTRRNWDVHVVEETSEIPVPLTGATTNEGQNAVLVS